MNNGNLLDNLLSASNASPVAKKSTKPSRTASPVGEGFHSTMQQIRIKPAAQSLAASAGQASKETRQEDVRKSSHSPAESPNHTERHSTTGKAPETRALTKESAQLDSAAPEPSGEELAPAASLEPQETQVKSQHELEPGSETALLALLQPPKDELTAGLSIGLTPSGLGEPGEEAELTEEAAVIPLPLPAGVLSVANTASNADGLSENGSNETPGLTLNLVAVGASSAASGLNLPVQDIETSSSPELELDAASGEVEGELSDNPSLLLLNAKTVMNKLAEANAVTLDKSAPTSDSLKSLTATAPAIESLNRMAESPSPAARGFVVQTGVPVALGQPQWGQAVGERVLWLAAQNVSAAEIRLDPPELGPLQVRVSVNQEQTSISFVSPHPAVREVLDQQLSRLREMFSEQGLNLGDVNVSDKSFAQQEQERRESPKSGRQALNDEEEVLVASTVMRSSRLVDHYA